MNYHSRRMAETTNRRAERLRMLVHFITAFVLILKGISKVEHPEGYEILIAVAFVGGAVILAGTLLHHQIARRFRYFGVAVFLIEALTYTIVGVISISHATRAIHYMWFMAAMGFTVSAVMTVVAEHRR